MDRFGPDNFSTLQIKGHLRGGSRIFLRRGCTSKEWRHWQWAKKIFKSEYVYTKFYLRGGAHPLHPPPRSAPAPEGINLAFDVIYCQCAFACFFWSVSNLLSVSPRIATVDSCFDLVGSRQHGVACNEIISWSTDHTHWMQMVITSDETQTQLAEKSHGKTSLGIAWALVNVRKVKRFVDSILFANWVPPF